MHLLVFQCTCCVVLVWHQCITVLFMPKTARLPSLPLVIVLLISYAVYLLSLELFTVLHIPRAA
jgi:hypothetical protein